MFLYLLRLKNNFISSDLNQWLEEYTPFLCEPDALNYIKDTCDCIFANLRAFLECFFASNLTFREFQLREGQLKSKNLIHIFFILFTDAERTNEAILEVLALPNYVMSLQRRFTPTAPRKRSVFYRDEQRYIEKLRGILEVFTQLKTDLDA